MLDQSEEPDYYRYTLRVPMASRPGEKAVYCSANPNLALGVMGRATGESPLDHLRSADRGADEDHAATAGRSIPRDSRTVAAACSSCRATS